METRGDGAGRYDVWEAANGWIRAALQIQTARPPLPHQNPHDLLPRIKSFNRLFQLVLQKMSTQQDTNPTVANAKGSAAQAADKTKATLNQTAEQIKAHPVYQQGQQRFTEYMGQLDKELGRYPVLNQLEEKTGVPKNYGVVVASLAFLSMIFINTLALPVSNLVGWAFPAFLSMRAIETPGHEDDIQWLTYWAVFGFFNFIESFALRLVIYYVPWYFPIKTAFIIWLQLPATRGAQTFYHSVFRPVVNNFKTKRAQYQGGSAPAAPYTTTTTLAPDHEKVL